MKVVLAIFAGILLPLSANALEMVEYKCYLETSKGHEIGFYRWINDNINSKIAALVASKRQDNKGQYYYVKQAIECVPLADDFSLKAAQKLDKKTPR